MGDKCVVCVVATGLKLRRYRVPRNSSHRAEAFGLDEAMLKPFSKSLLDCVTLLTGDSQCGPLLVPALQARRLVGRWGGSGNNEGGTN